MNKKTASVDSVKIAPHSRRTADQVRHNWRLGDYTPHGYLFSLLESLKASGLPIAIDSVDEFCKEWEINRRAFYRAKAKLITQGRLEEKIIGRVVLKLASKITNIGSDNFDPDSDSLDQANDNFDSTSDSFVTADTQLVTATPFKPSNSSPSEPPPDLYRSKQILNKDLSLISQRNSPEKRERDKKFMQFMRSRLSATCKGDLLNYVNTCLRNDSDRWETEYQNHLEKRVESPDSGQSEDVANPETIWDIKRREIMHYWPKHPELRKGMRSEIESDPRIGLTIDGDTLVEAPLCA